MRAGPHFEGLDPPYSTIQVNQIKGGLHGNIVAESCEFFWEMRIIPGESDFDVLARMERFAKEMLEPAMKAIDPDTGISIEVQARIPGLKPNGDASLDAELLELLGRSQPRFVSYGTEAGIFQNPRQKQTSIIAAMHWNKLTMARSISTWRRKKRSPILMTTKPSQWLPRVFRRTVTVPVAVCVHLAWVSAPILKITGNRSWHYNRSSQRRSESRNRSSTLPAWILS